MTFTAAGILQASQIALGTACLIFALCFVLLRRKGRMDVSTVVTWAPFMVANAAVQFLYAAHRAEPTAVVLVVTSIAAFSGLVAVIVLGWYLPKLSQLPSRVQMLRTQEALHRANAELEAFTASVSHDLRSPLTTIAGQAGLLEMSAGHKLDDDQRRRLQRIHASVKQMSQLIEALLSLSRISQANIEPEELDISALATKVLHELAQAHPDRVVDTYVTPGLRLRADRQMLTNVLEHLLGNAWKFAAKAPAARIEVLGEERDGEQLIGVRDNGCGFDMSQHDKIFHPFQRLHPQSEFPGAGVGLATASRIVARHGGRIWADSQPGQGATFWFTVGAIEA